MCNRFFSIFWHVAGTQTYLPVLEICVVSVISMEEVQNLVVEALPGLGGDGLLGLISKLKDCGVENVEDLKFVHETDLTDVLKPIQVRKLLQLIQSKLVSKNYFQYFFLFYFICPYKFGCHVR